MTTRNFFIYQSLLNASFGIGLLFMPQFLVDTYMTEKGEISGTLDFIARSYGTALIGFSSIAFMMRDSKPSLARYAFLLATCVTGILVTIVNIRAILQGVENNLAWGTVLLLIVIIAWSGLLVSKEKAQILD